VIADQFHWSLKEIDETDIESLIPFLFRYPQWKGKQATAGQAGTRNEYADQAEWL